MRDFFRRHVWHNFGLKVLSLGLAVLLWLAVSRDPIAEVAIEVPIEFRNVAQNMEISSENIPHAQIRLRGPERTIRRLQASDVSAAVDLSSMRAGEHTFDLTSQQVHAPSELAVVQIIPSQFHLAFDTRATRQVEVHPRVINAPGARVVTVPQVVTIVGPQRRVEAVDYAITEPIDASGVADRASFVRHAFVSDPLIQVVNPDPVRVTVIMEKVPASPDGK